MSRFVVSNVKSVVDDFTKHCVNVGFDRYKSANVTEKVFLSVFEKLCISNNNFFSNGKEWIAVTGTCFYKKRLSADCLSILLEDSTRLSLDELRSNMIGNYVVLLCRDDKISVFTDEQGVMNAFYYTSIKSNEWIVASSLYEMVKVSDADVKPLEYGVLEEIYAFQIFGNGTVFDGFKRLTGRDYVEIDLRNNTLSVLSWPVTRLFSIDRRNPDVVAKDASDLFKELATVVMENFSNKDIALCMTGGLDSRLVLSSFLATGAKPSLYYGTGNSMLTNTHKEDLDVNLMYAKKYGLESKPMDWRTPEKVDEAWDYYIEKYGMGAKLYSSSPMLMKSFESVTEKILFLGAFGEIFRNEMIAEHRSGAELSMDDLIDGFYFEGDVSTILGNSNKTQEFRNYLKDKFRVYLKPYLNENGKLPVDHFCFFANEFMIRGHLDKVLLVNQHRYSFAFFADPNLVRKAFVPVSERDDAKLIINILSKLYPEVLDIPMFSRNAWRVYDRESNSIVLLSKDPISKMKTQLFDTTSFGKHVKALLRPMVRKMNLNKNPRNTITHHYLANYLQPLIDENNIFHHNIHVVRSDYISKESRYAIMLRTFKKLNAKV